MWLFKITSCLFHKSYAELLYLVWQRYKGLPTSCWPHTHLFAARQQFYNGWIIVHLMLSDRLKWDQQSVGKVIAISDHEIICYYYFYSIIFPVVLYGCETWSLILMEECRLRIFENRILREIFGPKRHDKGSEEGFTIRNVVVLCCSPNIVRLVNFRRLSQAEHWGR